MRDALGGTVNLIIIVVFITLVLGYLAFNVNYTKAFRMKNKIISVYEDYHGNCLDGNDCQQAIQDYAKQVGYQPKLTSCPEGMSPVHSVIFSEGYSGMYCLKEIPVNRKLPASDSSLLIDSTEKVYYKVATKITLDVPIIKYFIGDLRVFWVYGDTKIFEKKV